MYARVYIIMYRRAPGQARDVIMSLWPLVKQRLNARASNRRDRRNAADYHRSFSSFFFRSSRIRPFGVRFWGTRGSTFCVVVGT